MMDHEFLFPTNIFLKNNAYQNPNELKQLMINEYQKDKAQWQSGPDLYTKKEYRKFVDVVLQNTKYILDILKYSYEGFRITDMWSNILKPGEMHRPHTHANNFLSGVYYPYAEEAPGIVFVDPRPAFSVIKPNKIENTKYNSDVYEYSVITNKMIIFPSWLQHYVPTNTSKSNRFSIAWNIQVKGKVGRSIDFQSAEFI